MSKSAKWQQYFMTMAYLVATKSKDPNTKIGAVIVGPDNEIRSTGYNGLPRGMNDFIDRYTKPFKYKLINHAEENAILHCALVGISPKGCSLYIPWIPCSLCAKSIIQSGIKEVIYHDSWPGNHNQNTDWAASIKLSKEMFLEVGIDLIKYDGPITMIKGLYQDQELDLYK